MTGRDRMRQLILSVASATMLALLAGCASQTLSVAPQMSQADIEAQYRLGTGDQVRITVFNQANLSGEYLVDGAGFIALPLIGPVKAGDSTARGVEQLIGKALKDGGFLVNPSVAVQISQFRPYYILGEVAQPGAYPYSSRLTVRNAVAAARGFTYRANTRRVFIQRSGESEERLFELTPATAVLPGDTIRIPERLF